MKNRFKVLDSQDRSWISELWWNVVSIVEWLNLARFAGFYCLTDQFLVLDGKTGHGKQIYDTRWPSLKNCTPANTWQLLLFDWLVRAFVKQLQNFDHLSDHFVSTSKIFKRYGTVPKLSEAWKFPSLGRNFFFFVLYQRLIDLKILLVLSICCDNIYF